MIEVWLLAAPVLQFLFFFSSFWCHFCDFDCDWGFSSFVMSFGEMHFPERVTCPVTQNYIVSAGPEGLFPLFHVREPPKTCASQATEKNKKKGYIVQLQNKGTGNKLFIWGCKYKTKLHNKAQVSKEGAVTISPSYTSCINCNALVQPCCFF